MDSDWLKMAQCHITLSTVTDNTKSLPREVSSVFLSLTELLEEHFIRPGNANNQITRIKDPDPDGPGVG